MVAEVVVQDGLAFTVVGALIAGVMSWAAWMTKQVVEIIRTQREITIELKHIKDDHEHLLGRVDRLEAR